MLRAEVALVGGGPAGCAAALALCARGIGVALVERSSYEAPRIGETLPPAIQCEFASLGVWKEFLAVDHLSSPGIQCAWGSAEAYEQSHLFDPYGPGWHVDRCAVDAALAAAVEARGALVLRGYRFVGIARAGSEEWRIHAASGAGSITVGARVVIDATGRTAAVARQLGARRRSADRLVALFRFFRGPPGYLAESPTAVEAVAEGWWYTAPLPGGRMVAALMTDADLGARHLLRDTAGWTERLRSAPLTRARVAGCAPEGPLQLAAAASSCLAPGAGNAWLAIGDAAVALDPLSGDGVRCALRSGIRAAEQVGHRLAGDAAALRKYDAKLARAFDVYLHKRHAFYSRESRWLKSTFWTRRCPSAA